MTQAKVTSNSKKGKYMWIVGLIVVLLFFGSIAMLITWAVRYDLRNRVETPADGVVANKCFTLKLPVGMKLRERDDSRCQLTANGDSNRQYVDTQIIGYDPNIESLPERAKRDTFEPSESPHIISEQDITFAEQPGFRLTFEYKGDPKPLNRYFVTIPNDPTHLIALTLTDPSSVENLASQLEQNWQWK